MVKKKKGSKSVIKKDTVSGGLELRSTKMDAKCDLKDCTQHSYRLSTVIMFILIMLGLLSCFYYFRQILETSSKDVTIQSNCAQINKMILELNNKVAALDLNFKSQADKSIEAKESSELESSANKLNIIKTSYTIKKLVDGATDYSKEQDLLKRYLKNSFIEEQEILNRNKEKALIADQELIAILTKDINQQEETKAPVGTAEKIKDSVNKAFKVKKVEEKIAEQSFANNVNMAIVKILAHEYSEAVKYIEYTSNKPESYKSVLDTLKAKAAIKAALDAIIDKTLQDQ